MSPLLKEALKRERAFQELESRRNDFTNGDFKVNWLDGLGVAFVFGLLVVALNFI